MSVVFAARTHPFLRTYLHHILQAFAFPEVIVVQDDMVKVVVVEIMLVHIVVMRMLPATVSSRPVICGRCYRVPMLLKLRTFQAGQRLDRLIIFNLPDQ